MQRHLGTIVALIICSTFASCVSATYNHYRLPTSIQPDSYEVKIITYLEDANNLSFEGDVFIHFKVLENTSNITLHAHNLTIDESKITLRSSSDENFKYCSKGIETVPEHDYFIIQLCDPLQKDQMYTVKLHFSASLAEILKGYYRSSYVNQETNEKRWLSVTQFEPIGARAAFPCFDEPNYKAKFTIWLGHHKSLTAISNMPLETQLPINNTDNFVWSIFEESVPMSTYLVAYTVNDYGHITSTQLEGSKVEFRTWYQKQFLDQCNFAAEVGPKVLKYFEETFGIPFPLSKVDTVGVPDFESGAMENWGLITYKASSLVFDPKISPESSKGPIVFIIAHELAHQWFGNLVTMKWWSDIWLNEGFATYVASLGAQNFNSELNAYIEDHVHNIMIIFREDMKESSHPITEPILNSADIKKHFDSISYRKGSMILRMLHMFMGDDGFFTAVRSYLEKHKYQNAEQDDLWDAFTVTAREYNLIKPEYSIKTIMDSWTLQSGYPLVKVTRDYRSGKVHITQQRYMQTPEIPDEEAQKCWWIPLSYTTASEIDFVTTLPKAWMECDETGQSLNLTLDYVASGDEWILFNLQVTAVYRVQYDKENWRLIKNVLNSQEYTNIHILNRIQLVADVLSLAWTGHESYDVAFDILDYLVQEQEYVPWASALKHLVDVKNMLERSREHSEYFKAYMNHILGPIYKQVTDNSSNTQDALTHKEFIKLFSVTYELDESVSMLRDYFQEWKSFAMDPNADNPLPSDRISQIYSIGISYGDSDDWQFVWQYVQQLNESLEKAYLLQSLTCSRNTTILRNFLEIAFNETEIIDEKTAIQLLMSTAFNIYGFSVAWEYFESNIDHFKTSDSVCEIITYFANQMSMSPKAIESYKNFLDNQNELLEKCKTDKEALVKIIDTKVKWFERNGETIKESLKKRLFVKGIQKDEISKD